MGESLLKGRPTWTKWAASRKGLTVDDWAAPWLEELAKCNLPGPDFIILAPNATLDAWLPRPAEYRDFSRALHLLLMLYCGESPTSVVEYTPHGCRHVMVTAGTQLVAQGILNKIVAGNARALGERIQDARAVQLSLMRNRIADKVHNS